jgi:hypothetical protein
VLGLSVLLNEIEHLQLSREADEALWDIVIRAAR